MGQTAALPPACARDSGRQAKPKVSVVESVTAFALESCTDGQLAFLRGGERIPVRVHRCFPWSEPGRFLSLRDEKDKELALIEDLAALDAASREVLELAQAEAGFVLEVERIVSAEEVFEIRHFKVVTKQGPRTFQTKLDEWPREVPRGGYLLKDVSGDLYHIPAPETMDERSQTILWGLVD